MEPEIAELTPHARSADGLARGQDAATAVAALFRDHHLELVRLATVMVGDVGAAEDVVQEAFERLQSGWHRLRNEDSALAYARSAVLNGCRTVLRRSATARRRGLRLLVASAPWPDTAQAVAESSELMTALRALPARQREVLVLRFYLDLDVAEVAQMLQIGPSAVRSTSARALARLAQSMKES